MSENIISDNDEGHRLTIRVCQDKKNSVNDCWPPLHGDKSSRDDFKSDMYLLEILMI